MRRPGPLKDLPLDLFNSQANQLFKATPIKRPISPSTAIFSPTKRRIINDDLLFSPQKTPRTSLFGSKLPHRALDGPGSPARKLHFGLPESLERSDAGPLPTPGLPSGSCPTTVAGSTRAQSPSMSHKLAPSPELKPKSRSSHKNTLVETNDDLVKHENIVDVTTTTIPRELPSLPDRHSIHHPGFDIYQDTHIFLSYGCQSLVAEQGKDGQKENIPPRRTARKAEPTTPGVEKGADLLKKLPSAPLTPRKPSSIVGGKWNGPTSPTPRRPTTGLRSMIRTPLSTPIASKTDRRERKRVMLEEELDDDGGSEDDGNDLVDPLI